MTEACRGTAEPARRNFEAAYELGRHIAGSERARATGGKLIYALVACRNTRRRTQLAFTMRTQSILEMLTRSLAATERRNERCRAPRAAGPHRTAHGARSSGPRLTRRTRSDAWSVSGGAVDDVAQLLAAGVAAEVVGEQREQLVGVAVLRRGAVRRDVDVRRVPQRVVGRERLLAGDVEDRAAEVARLRAPRSARGSSTSEPRPTLQNSAPGFIAANAAASNRFSVSGGTRRARRRPRRSGRARRGGRRRRAARRPRGASCPVLVAAAGADGGHAERAGAHRDLGADGAQTDDRRASAPRRGARTSASTRRARCASSMLVEALPHRRATGRWRTRRSARRPRRRRW